MNAASRNLASRNLASRNLVNRNLVSRSLVSRSLVGDCEVVNRRIGNNRLPWGADLPMLHKIVGFVWYNARPMILSIYLARSHYGSTYAAERVLKK